jgi:hypothetical protein
MRTNVIGSFVLVASLMAGLPVFAMGGDYEINADGNIVSQQPDWPAGLADLINSGPVFSGHWVNANSEFFYLGNTASLERFITRYATLENPPLAVVIHAGSERGSALWGDKPKEQYDWKVWVQNRQIPEKQLWTVTVDVWIDRNIRLSEYKLPWPRNVGLRPAGEIERFIRSALGKVDLGPAGWQTYNNYAKAVRDGQEKKVEGEAEIPAKYWSEPIKALKPIKVYVHRLNVVVVQRVENNVEEGKYIINVISSLAPRTGDDGFVFTLDPVSRAMDFKRTKGE